MSLICYHGTGANPFCKFDLNHILEGDGKCKFGIGIYVTTVYRTAAHYSGANGSAVNHYVYTVEIPTPSDSNCLRVKEPVNKDIILRAESALGCHFPPEATKQGSCFRKYLANVLSGNLSTLKHMITKADIVGEKAASQFLKTIGVLLLSWPYSWKNPSAGTNYAVLSEEDVKIKKIESVSLDSKIQLIEGSQKIVKIF